MQVLWVVVLHFLGLLHTDSYVFFISDPGVICCWGCYYSHFQMKMPKLRVEVSCSKIILLIYGRTRIQIQSVYPQKQLLPFGIWNGSQTRLQEWKSLYILQSNRQNYGGWWWDIVIFQSHFFATALIFNCKAEKKKKIKQLWLFVQITEANR